MSENAPSAPRLAYLRARARRERRIRFLQIFVLLTFALLWELSARLGWVDEFIVSSPSRIALCLKNLYTGGELWLHIGVSCLETVAGFLLGTLLGTLVAVILWWSPFLSRVSEPYLVVLNALPKTALGPIFIVWIGAGTASIIAMTLAISIIVTILSMHSGKAAAHALHGRKQAPDPAASRASGQLRHAFQYAARKRRAIVGRRYHGRISRFSRRAGISDSLRLAGFQHGPRYGYGDTACRGGSDHVPGCDTA